MNNNNTFNRHLAKISPSPITVKIDRAEGIYIWDSEGNKYIDMVSGLAVSNIGHRHPKVVKAIKNQLDKHMHIMPYGDFIQVPQSKLAEKLTTILPEKLNSCYFVNSGAEANEAALKLAKRYTGRTQIISFKKSYHGNTHGAMSVSGNEQKKNAFRPLLTDIEFIEYNNIDDLSCITERTACVIIEAVQGDAGVRIPSKEFMFALRKRCDETGALLIFDEIQTGFGRTGTMFAFEWIGIIPDIITIAKGLGGGMPIGAFISNKDIMDTLSNNPMLGHITTFGGHAIPCAAALANIEVLLEENWINKVEEKGKLLEESLNHHKIKEIRRKGLMLAIDLEDENEVSKVVHECLKNGLITYWFLSCPKSFRLSPPLCITDSEIRKASSVIIESLSTL